VTVTTEPMGSARVVRWDRRAKRNAWTRETIEGIAGALDAAARTRPCAASSSAARARTSRPGTTCTPRSKATPATGRRRLPPSSG
jgi:hypothetical protein